MTRRDLEKRLAALEDEHKDLSGLSIAEILSAELVEADESDGGSDTLTEAIKKAHWEEHDEGERERTTHEKVDRAVRDDDDEAGRPR